MANFTGSELGDVFLESASHSHVGAELNAGAKNLVPPIISALDPPAGTDIEPDQIVTFEVTDDVGAFARIFVVAKDLDSGVAEVVHDGDAFNGFYVEQSTRVLITGGIRYELLRRNGWTGTRLEISAFAIDEDGNEGTL
jgi:hypothetical protein